VLSESNPEIEMNPRHSDAGIDGFRIADMAKIRRQQVQSATTPGYLSRAQEIFSASSMDRSSLKLIEPEQLMRRTRLAP